LCLVKRKRKKMKIEYSTMSDFMKKVGYCLMGKKYMKESKEALEEDDKEIKRRKNELNNLEELTKNE